MPGIMLQRNWHQPASKIYCHEILWNVLIRTSISEQQESLLKIQHSPSEGLIITSTTNTKQSFHPSEIIYSGLNYRGWNLSGEVWQFILQTRIKCVWPAARGSRRLGNIWRRDARAAQSGWSVRQGRGHVFLWFQVTLGVGLCGVVQCWTDVWFW